MVQTRSSSSKKNTTDTSIGINHDVAEASNKNTMNKTTAENSILKPIKASKKTTKKVISWGCRTSVESKSPGKSKRGLIMGDLRPEHCALEMFMLEYVKKHCAGRRISSEEDSKGQQKFHELVKKKGSEFVNKYFKKYEDFKAEERKRYEESVWFWRNKYLF